MIRSNLSTTDQLGFKQPPYTKPNPQVATAGCNSLILIDSGIELNFVKDYLFVKVTPLQIPRGMPCEQINTENIPNDTNPKLSYIISGNNLLPLKKPLEYAVDFRDDMWTMENKELGIISMYADYAECLRDFNEEVYFIYEEYGQEEDGNLTNDAKELKRKILQHITE